MGDVDLSAVGALLAHQSRALMLDALLAGRALTVGELALVAGVRASTASEHLARLLAGGFVDTIKQGRHRYYQLAGPEVASALEGIAQIAPRQPAHSLTQSRRAQSLAEARLCYDHLAGRSGVQLHDALLAQGWLSPNAGGFELTPSGESTLGGWGVDVTMARHARRSFARPCLDWTERRYHLAGALASAIADCLIDGPSPWFTRRVAGHRGLRITDRGQRALADLSEISTLGSEPAKPL
jgi:DNA-binding transcriptional ArsR family regulator